MLSLRSELPVFWEAGNQRRVNFRVTNESVAMIT